MTQIKFNNLPRAERKLVFQEISNQTGLPDYAVEKGTGSGHADQINHPRPIFADQFNL